METGEEFKALLDEIKAFHDLNNKNKDIAWLKSKKNKYQEYYNDLYSALKNCLTKYPRFKTKYFDNIARAQTRLLDIKNILENIKIKEEVEQEDEIESKSVEEEEEVTESDSEMSTFDYATASRLPELTKTGNVEVRNFVNQVDA